MESSTSPMQALEQLETMEDEVREAVKKLPARERALVVMIGRLCRAQNDVGGALAWPQRLFDEASKDSEAVEVAFAESGNDPAMATLKRAYDLAKQVLHEC